MLIVISSFPVHDKASPSPTVHHHDLQHVRNRPLGLSDE